MKRYFFIAASAVLVSASMLIGSGFALNLTEADSVLTPDTADTETEAQSTYEAYETDTAADKTEYIETSEEIQKPDILENLSEEAKAKISRALQKALNDSDKDSYIVSIWLNHNIDENYINEKVYNEINISKDDTIAYANNVIGKGKSQLSDEEKEQLDSSRELHDIYLASRRKCVREFFESKAEEFLKENNISKTENTFIFSYVPFIENVEVTASQIISLAYNENVTEIEYHGG